jgi:hypothetical protein
LEVVEREYIKEKKATAKDFEVLFFYIGVKQNIVTSYHHSKMTDTKLGEIIFSLYLTKNLTTYLIEPSGPCCCRRVYVLWNICVTKDHGYVPVAVTTSRLFSPI